MSYSCQGQYAKMGFLKFIAGHNLSIPQPFKNFPDFLPERFCFLDYNALS